MASMASAKSQALHNFALPHLKWNKDNNNHSNGHHRRRRSIKSPPCESNPSSDSPLIEPPLQSPLRDSASAMLLQSQKSPLGESSQVRDDSMNYSFIRGDSLLRNSGKQFSAGGDSAKQSTKHNLGLESDSTMTNKNTSIEYHRNHLSKSASEANGNVLCMSSLDRAIDKSKNTPKGTEPDASSKRSRIVLKIPHENESNENQQDEDDDGNDEEGKLNNNEEPKTWNLRPRRPNCKSNNGFTAKVNGSGMQDKKSQSPLRNSSSRLGENETNGCEGLQKKEKRKMSVSIPLSKEEIEEDVFILTGSKPVRRPKKRAKNIQKHVDCLFPGLWLTSITPDSYKVSDAYLKG